MPPAIRAPGGSPLRAARCKLAVCALAVVGLAAAAVMMSSSTIAPSMLRMRRLTRPGKRAQCDDWDLGKEMARVRCPCDGCR